MAFDWFKRKYIFSPTNPHSIRILTPPLEYYPGYWEWICPDDYWCELLSLFHRFTTVAGFRDKGSLWLWLHRNDTLSMSNHTRFEINSNQSYYISWQQCGAQTITIPSLTYITEMLPANYYIFPGDRLNFFWRSPQTWDGILSPVLTIKRYELY